MSFEDRFKKAVEVHGLRVEQEAIAVFEGGELDTGCTVWPAALDLAEKLLASCSAPQSSSHVRGGLDPPGHAELRRVVQSARILELGSGTGLAGLACAAAGAAEVLMTDLPARLPLLKRNVQANRWVSSLGGCAVKVAELDWNSAESLDETLNSLQPDLILGADLVHEVEHADAVVQVLRRAFATFPRARFLWAQEAHNAMAVAALRGALEKEIGLEFQAIGNFGSRGKVNIGLLRDQPP
eukprot:6208020-Pleurochrysis_carterae.AAC.3